MKLPTGDTGLVHISEIADEYVKDIRSFVTEDQAVTVKVLGRNKKGKFDLSIKQVGGAEPAPRRSERPERSERPQRSDRPQKSERTERPQRQERSQRSEPDQGAEGGGERNKEEFEDKLKKWRRESEERLLDVKRNTENKRGGGRYRK